MPPPTPITLSLSCRVPGTPSTFTTHVDLPLRQVYLRASLVSSSGPDFPTRTCQPAPVPHGQVCGDQEHPLNHSLILARKELPFFYSTLFLSFYPARPGKPWSPFRGYSSLAQALSLRMTSLTRLEVCLRGRILDGNSDPFPLPRAPNDPRGRLKMLCRIINLSPSLKKLDVEGLPILSGADFVEWQQPVGKLSKLRSLRASVLIWCDKVSNRWLHEWMNLLAMCPPSLCDFKEYRVYFMYPGHKDDCDHFQIFLHNTLQDEDVYAYTDDDDGRVTTVVARSINRGRCPELRELEIHRAYGDETGTSADLKQSLEACPNLDALRLLGFHPGMGGDDLADVVVTGCPRLKKLLYDATSYPQDNIVSFKILSITRNKNQVEDLSADALSLEEARLSLARLALQRHSQSLCVVRIGNCADNQPSRYITLVLTECVGLEDLSTLPSNDCIESCIDPVDAAATVPWASTKIRRLLLGVTIPVLPGYPSQVAPVGAPF